DAVAVLAERDRQIQHRPLTTGTRIERAPVEQLTSPSEPKIRPVWIAVDRLGVDEIPPVEPVFVLDQQPHGRPTVRLLFAGPVQQFRGQSRALRHVLTPSVSARAASEIPCPCPRGAWCAR